MQETELETLLGYAKKFLGRVQGSISIEEFGYYLQNFDKHITSLNDPAVAARINKAVLAVKSCSHVLRNDPTAKNEIVIPVVEEFIGAIQKEIQLTA